VLLSDLVKGILISCEDLSRSSEAFLLPLPVNKLELVEKDLTEVFFETKFKREFCKTIKRELCKGKLTNACGLGGLVKDHSSEL
jgi:hypothetical protein